MATELFSKEIVTYYTGSFDLEINYSKHTESLVMLAEPNYDSDFDNEDVADIDLESEPREEECFYIIKDVAQDYIWMSLLDFDPEDAPSTLDAFSYMEKAFEHFSFLDISKQVCKEGSRIIHHIPFDSAILADFDNISLNVLDNLRFAMEMKPALGYLFPLFQMTLHQLWNWTHRLKEDEPVIYFANTSFNTLAKEISNFRKYYEQAREAMHSIFVLPEAMMLPATSEEVTDLYKVYAALKRIPLFNTHRTGEDPNQAEPDEWEDFLMSNYGVAAEDAYEYTSPTFKKFIMNAIDSLSTSNAVLRKCALCGGYFRTRRNTKQSCCARLYRDTKTTCYEYISRKQYQERLKEHPVYQEYIKAYNRLYGRIRRKAVPASTPLTDKLKELRDEYYEKYDNAAPSDQPAVLQELVEKNEKLLS